MPNPPANNDSPPQSWLFAPSSLGGSFRVYLPTVVAMRVLGLLRMLAFAWLIFKTEYGLQRLALQLINLLSAVARLGVPVGLERYAPTYEQSGQLRHFVRRGLWIGTIITAALTLLLAATSPWLSGLAFSGGLGEKILRAPGETPASAGYLVQLTLGCLAVTLMLTAYFSVQGVLRGLRMYRALAVMEVLHGVTFLIFGIGGLALAGDLRLSFGPASALHAASIVTHRLPFGWTLTLTSGWIGPAVVLTLAYGVSLLVTSGWIGLGLARHLGRWPAQHRPMDLSSRSFTALLLRFSGYMTGSNVLWSVFFIFGLWYINKRLGESEAGLFAASRDLMQTVQLLGMAVWPTAQNSAAHLWDRGQRAAAVEQIGLVFRLSGWPLWILCAVMALARPVIEKLLPAEYAGASLVLPWLLVMFMWMVHLSLPTAYAFMLKNSRMLLAAAIVGLAVHAASAVWLVPKGRSIGGAQSAALGTAAATVTLLWLVTRASRQFRWVTGRDAPLLLAPILLAAPSAWRQGGDFVLVTATVSAIVLLIATDVLWSRSDRETFTRYVSHSFAVIFRRGRPPE